MQSKKSDSQRLYGQLVRLTVVMWITVLTEPEHVKPDNSSSMLVVDSFELDVLLAE